MNHRFFIFVAFLAALLAPLSVVAVEERPVIGYLGGAGGMLLPGNGVSLRRAGAAQVRAGCYFTDYWALEVEGACAPAAGVDRGGDTPLAGLALASVGHLSGWTAFDRLFGCERFDPFVTAGFGVCRADRAVFAGDEARTSYGPFVGCGAFYHLTDAWSLRADCRAQLCCAAPCGLLYGISVGVQYSWGAE